MKRSHCPGTQREISFYQAMVVRFAVSRQTNDKSSLVKGENPLKDLGQLLSRQENEIQRAITSR